MDLGIVRHFKKLGLRLHHRNALVITPRARRLIAIDDIYEYFDIWGAPHVMSFDDRNGNECFLVPDPDSGVTTAMLAEEFLS